MPSAPRFVIVLCVPYKGKEEDKERDVHIILVYRIPNFSQSYSLTLLPALSIVIVTPLQVISVFEGLLSFGSQENTI